MKRIVVLCTAVALGVAAAPASARNSGEQPLGPPLFSGYQGKTVVVHCKQYVRQGAAVGSGVTVENKNGVPVHTCRM